MKRYLMTIATVCLIASCASAVDNPRCEPMKIGTKATIEDAAASIATCPVEHVLVLSGGLVVHHARGTKTEARFPVPANSGGFRAVHNHPNGERNNGMADRCAALLLGELHTVLPNGMRFEVEPTRRGSWCDRVMMAEGVR